MRRFGPKSPDHPTVGRECPACKVAFEPGDWTTLVVLGPGADEEARDRAREHRAYNAFALEVHYACATGWEDDPGDIFQKSSGQAPQDSQEVRERFITIFSALGRARLGAKKADRDQAFQEAEMELRQLQLAIMGGRS